MTVQRMDASQLEKLLGESGLQQLLARHRGGVSNQSGNDYERAFIVHRLARLARKLLTDNEDAEIEWQAEFTPVDDVVIRRDSAQSFKGYQLKNTKSVSWRNGNPSLADSFKDQHRICSEEGYKDIRLRLCCSCEDKVSDLNADCPEDISSYSSAIFFPRFATIRSVLSEFPWLRDDLTFLSRSREPKDIDADQIFSILSGAWAAHGRKAKVSEVIKTARRTSPTLVRAFRKDEEAESQLQAEFRNILNAIPDFQYHIVKGFLHWEATLARTKGVFSYDCFTEQFGSLQRQVINSVPKSFADIEDMLL